MEKNLYIDASHPEETRVVLKSKSSIEEYEFEDKNKINFKNNIYLGVVSRVEPSLQAAFIDFGRDRHGFLSFNDIQSDYYQLPKDDLEKIILDADILSSLMFGPQVGVKLASRLKQEIRYNDDSELLFSNFLKLLGGKCLYLDYSKKAC